MRKIAILPFFILLLLAGCGTAQESKQGENTEQQHTSKAIFVGLSDTHSVEVKIKNKPVTLDFTDSFTGNINQFKAGEHVTVTYTKNEKGQYDLNEIK